MSITAKKDTKHKIYTSELPGDSLSCCQAARRIGTALAGPTTALLAASSGKGRFFWHAMKGNPKFTVVHF